MQADEAGLRETIPERKNKERQDVMHLGVLHCTQIWRPQADLNAVDGVKGRMSF